MKKVPLAVGLLLSFAAAFGQKPDSLNRVAEPKGGMAALALVYYKIDFTREETEYLRANEAELIFMVNENGKATLEEVKDIAMHSVVDSMMRMNDRLPEFYPEAVNGKPQNALFFMRLRWPQYEALEPAFPPSYNRYHYMGRRLDEFEFIDYTGSRFDILFGAVGNTIGGNVINYIYSGGGVKFDMLLYSEKGWGGGMVMTFHGNRMRKEYPLTTLLPQNKSRVTGFIGLAVAKLLNDRPAGQFSIQFEACYSMQSIESMDPNLKNKPVQAMGFSPGLVINYAKNLGRGRMTAYYYIPTAMRSYLNFHIALRPMILNIPEASGLMYEAGISYRMAMRHARNFKLK